LRDRLVLIVSIVAKGEKTNKSSSLPGVNNIEEKIEKEKVKIPKTSTILSNQDQVC